MRYAWFRAALIACVLLSVTSCSAADLTDWLPADLNAVLSINVAGLYDTPLAKREDWAGKARDAFVHHEAVVPPGLQEFVVGAELDLGNDFTPLRTFAVAAPKAGLTIESMAALSGAATFPLDGKPAVETSRGGVVVQAQPSVWIGVGKGGRQAAVRWLKAQKSSGADLKALRTALAQRGPKSQIALAINLSDAVNADNVDAVLSQLPDNLAAAKKAKLIPLLTSAQHAVLSVTVSDAISGELRIELGSAAAELSPLLKALIPAVLQQLGMSGAGVDGWTWTTKGNAVIGTGALTASDTRRILSIVQHPTSSLAASASSSGTDADATAKSLVVSSQRYLKSLRTILDDMQATLKRTRDNHALWFERAADKIDDLPMRNVDPELLDYGQKASSSLRYQGQVQRMTNVKAGTTKKQTKAGNTYSTAYAFPYRGYAVVNETGADPAAIDAAANEAALDVRFSEWKQIEEGLVQIRRRMTEKLMADF
ncbi:MAG TPA: hypothetical protein VM165_20705 [Planctomycetaceae bacterium]|nr:hypothetical protein [Planctomycetaceae bacterium]